MTTSAPAATAPAHDVLLQKHPRYLERASLWKRWRAFGGAIEKEEDKRPWLPKGNGEHEDDYARRLSLSHDTGLTMPALRRLTGTLNKAGTKFGTEHSKLPQAVIDAATDWRSNIDGTHRDLDSWWGDTLPELLRMGMVGVEVCKDELDIDSVSPLRAPFLCNWAPEEIINWSEDDRGVLEWVVLHRRKWLQDQPNESGTEVDVVRILYRDRGEQFVIGPPEGVDGVRKVTTDGEWQHDLGMVPLAILYAHKEGPMEGRSYVDQITKNDWRKLQLESDQAESSYHNANPTGVLKTSGKLAEVMAGGATRILKLDPSNDESFEWVKPGSEGLAMREEMLARNGREGMNSAGIDPAGSGYGDGSTARSGLSMAWMFTAQEEPLLNLLAEELEAGERRIIEIVIRWLLPRSQALGPYEAAFDGSISRPRGWDLLATRELIELATVAWSLVPSIAFKKKLALAIVSRILPDLTASEKEEIAEEVAKSDSFDLTQFNDSAGDDDGQSQDDDPDAQDADENEEQEKEDNANQPQETSNGRG